MKYDLHCHSTCSDGTYAPDELVKLAKNRGIDVLALTDHDTISGLQMAKQTAESIGLTFIFGVEISCVYTLTGSHDRDKQRNKIIHVVGLNFTDIDAMQQQLQFIQDSRANRGLAMVKKLADILHIDADALWQQVLIKASGDAKAVGRSHIAQVLHQNGYVPTVQSAFSKYLADNKPAYVKLDALSLQDGVALIHHCGGKAVLAHPTRYDLSATCIRRLMADFAEYGGDACELPATDEPLSKRKMIDRVIQQHDLQVSVGSDFHGTSMPWRALGDVAELNATQVGVWHDWQI